ncbi:unnamed protein product, partial [Polarella glacialis]
MAPCRVKLQQFFFGTAFVRSLFFWFYLLTLSAFLLSIALFKFMQQRNSHGHRHGELARSWLVSEPTRVVVVVVAVVVVVVAVVAVVVVVSVVVVVVVVVVMVVVVVVV